MVEWNALLLNRTANEPCKDLISILVVDRSWESYGGFLSPPHTTQNLDPRRGRMEENLRIITPANLNDVAGEVSIANVFLGEARLENLTSRGRQ